MTSPTIALHNMDCMEYMSTLPDKAFDLAIVDPPYGIGKRLSGGKAPENGFRSKDSWDKMRQGWDAAAPSADYFAELRRVSVHQIIWGANYFTEHLPPSMGWVFWYKLQPDFSFSDGEFAFTSFDQKARCFNLARGSELSKSYGEPIHPTQKPVALYRWLLRTYAKPGWKILDTHLGSGSIALACHDLGYDLVGTELDTDYFNAAVKRLDNHRKQERLDFQTSVPNQ